MEQQISDFLKFTAGVLEAAVGGDPPQPAKGERCSGPWYRKAPGSKQFLPYVREFAASGGLVSLNIGAAVAISGKIAPPLVPMEQKLQIDTRFTLFGSPQSHILDIPYPNDAICDLCCGRWVRFGPGGVRFNPTCLLPVVGVDGENMIIAWPSAPQAEVQVWQEHPGPIRRMLGRMIKDMTHTTLDRIVIRPDYIDVQAGGMLMNNAIPRIVPE
jgi:hypothetical protein